jgi:soluble cytochrome b562
MSDVQTTTPARSSLFRWTAGGTGIAAVLATVAIAAWPASAADTARDDGERVGEAVVQVQEAQTTEEVDAGLAELDAAVNEARSHASEELDEQITDQADALDRTVDGFVGAVETDDEFEAELYELQLDDAVNDLADNGEDFRAQGPEVHDAFWEGVEDGLSA